MPSPKRGASRGRGNPELEDPVVLCRDDRRKLYSLLDGDVTARLRRIEIVLGGLLVVNVSPKVGGPPVVPALLDASGAALRLLGVH